MPLKTETRHIIRAAKHCFSDASKETDYKTSMELMRAGHCLLEMAQENLRES